MKKVLQYSLFALWLINGLYAKVMSGVPRHEKIVSEILSEKYAMILTLIIGIGEIGIALWVISGWHQRLNYWIQIALILIMNTLEFMLVPELLLFGKVNLVLAILLSGIIFINLPPKVKENVQSI